MNNHAAFLAQLQQAQASYAAAPPAPTAADWPVPAVGRPDWEPKQTDYEQRERMQPVVERMAAAMRTCEEHFKHLSRLKYDEWEARQSPHPSRDDEVAMLQSIIEGVNYQVETARHELWEADAAAEQVLSSIQVAPGDDTLQFFLDNARSQQEQCRALQAKYTRERE